MRAAVLAVLTVLLAVAAAVVPALAQEERYGGSFLTPYPGNDTYQVQVVGDWYADGLLGGLLEAYGREPRVQVQRRRYDLSGLMLRGSERELSNAETAFASDPSHVAIVMLGGQDRYSIRQSSIGKRNEKWRTEYANRVDRLMRALKQSNRAVYWIGLPNMRRWQDNERAQLMNEIIRERAYRNGVRYIDAYAGFVDEAGGYSRFGPDVTGKTSRLRDRDGVYFTDAGYRKLAHYVQREFKRDMAQAKQERAIPLAGDPTQQARINPNRARLKKDEASKNKSAKAKKKGRPSRGALASRGDQKADPGTIDLKVVGSGGAEEVVAVEIVRPAIPASVVAIVTRKQSPDRPAQMGDLLVDQIAGGLTVMSSIVPPRGEGAGRRKFSPTQTPYFRVLEKGERLPPKPGRSDDVTWPRPQATAELTNAAPVNPVPVPTQKDAGQAKRN